MKKPSKKSRKQSCERSKKTKKGRRNEIGSEDRMGDRTLKIEIEF